MNHTFSLSLPRAGLCLAAVLLSSLGLRADDAPNQIGNSGFEDTPVAFSLFTPSDSLAANCRFTISTDTFHGGKQSALMQADDFARFSLGPNGNYPVAAGDLYRIGVWVKAKVDFQVAPNSPGIVIRLNQTGATPDLTGFTFIYLNGLVSQPAAAPYSPLPVTDNMPTEWTHLEAVVKIPVGIDHIAPALFFWRAKGSLYVDDFSLQKVDPSTPVSSTASP